MSRFKNLSHSVYECKNHLVFCPKYRFRIFKDGIAECTIQQVYYLCSQKEDLSVLELNVQEDHVHLVLSIAPKYSVSSIMGFLNDRLSQKLFRKYNRIG